ncbi:MAG: glycosyltransferase family 4 protein [Chloroflexota bacterium]
MSHRAMYEFSTWMKIKPTPSLYYIVPNANWVIDEIGAYLVRTISHTYDLSAHVSLTDRWLRGQIVHYGTLGSFVRNLQFGRIENNISIATVFHGNRTEQFPELKRQLDLLVEHKHLPTQVITASSLMADRLAQWQIPREKITRIPLGVHLTNFQPTTLEHKKQIRHQLNIPDDHICIGSFQKDGNGWGEGDTPKLIKGPDVFLQVIERLHKHYPIHVLLTAPSRGYVKRGLEQLGVPYTHRLLANHAEIVDYYHCLDLYLVASREEGGPEALPESMATGIPLVSTRVGMAPDMIVHEQNGLLAEVEDVEGLAASVARLIEDDELRQKIIDNGYQTVQAYDWSHLAHRYYHEVYQPILEQLT